MNRRQSALVRAFLTAVRPWRLGMGVLFYALGGGIAAYLGERIDWPVYFIGQAALLLLQIAGDFLLVYFDRSNQPPFESFPRQVPKSDGDEQPLLPRSVFLQFSYALLTAGAVLTALLLARGSLPPVALLFLGLAFFLTMLYALPPFRLAVSGYGELLIAILLANLFPALSFLLQAGELHRLLALITFPLTFLMLAAELARSLQGYGQDMRTGRMTMLRRLGWQRGMDVHNFFVVAGFGVLALSTLIGLDLRLVWPGFLALPLGLWGVVQMNRIASGAKPSWRVLNLTSAAMTGVTVYLLTLALWFN